MVALVQSSEGTLMCSVSCLTYNGKDYKIHDYTVERWYVDCKTGEIDHRGVGVTEPDGEQWEEFYDEMKAYGFSADVLAAALNSYDP